MRRSDTSIDLGGKTVGPLLSKKMKLAGALIPRLVKLPPLPKAEE
jgi:hypothetical protein